MHFVFQASSSLMKYQNIVPVSRVIQIGTKRICKWIPKPMRRASKMMTVSEVYRTRQPSHPIANHWVYQELLWRTLTESRPMTASPPLRKAWRAAGRGRPTRWASRSPCRANPAARPASSAPAWCLEQLKSWRRKQIKRTKTVEALHLCHRKNINLNILFEFIYWWMNHYFIFYIQLCWMVKCTTEQKYFL